MTESEIGLTGTAPWGEKFISKNVWCHPQFIGSSLFKSPKINASLFSSILHSNHKKRRNQWKRHQKSKRNPKHRYKLYRRTTLQNKPIISSFQATQGGLITIGNCHEIIRSCYFGEYALVYQRFFRGCANMQVSCLIIL